MACIVVASEDMASIEMLMAVLSTEGHEVVEAINGQDAYEEVLARETSLVFVSARLSVFNGYETCAMIREDPDIPETLPVIFIEPPEVERHQFERVGATDVLGEHYVTTELTDMLVKYLGPEAVV